MVRANVALAARLIYDLLDITADRRGQFALRPEGVDFPTRDPRGGRDLPL